MRTVAGVDFLGEAVVRTGTRFHGTEVGGLSSITYDEHHDRYYTLSDDRGIRRTRDPIRFYTVTIDLSDGSFHDRDLEFVDVTQLYDLGNVPFRPGDVDPESLALGAPGELYLCSEGELRTDPIIDPFIRHYDLRGAPVAELPIPEYYLPNGVDRGVRLNLAFESLNPTPDRRRLVTATEGALFQDGPISTYDQGSLVRILEYDRTTHTPVAEHVHEVGPIAEPSAVSGVNGIVALLPIDDSGTVLVLERSFSIGGVLGRGTGNFVVINEISTDGATDTLGVDALYEDGAPIPLTPASRRRVFELDDLGFPIDNVEGMTFGPPLADGRHTLVLVSDNNFHPDRFTQFIVLALDIEKVDGNHGDGDDGDGE